MIFKKYNSHTDVTLQFAKLHKLLWKNLGLNKLFFTTHEPLLTYFIAKNITITRFMFQA